MACIEATLQLMRVFKSSDPVRYAQLLMLAKALPRLLLRVPRNASRTIQSRIQNRRCVQFLQGNWRRLFASFLSEMRVSHQFQPEARSHNTTSPASTPPKIQMALNKARKGQ